MSDKKSPWGSGPGKGGSGSGKGPKNSSGSTGSSSGKSNNPWGSGSNPGDRRPPGSNRPNAGETSPDLEKVLNRLKTRMGGSGRGSRKGGEGGRGGGRGPSFLTSVGPLGIVALLFGVYLLFTSIYMIDTNEEGIVLRFGKYSRITDSGPHLKFPSPIETVEVVDISSERNITIGAGSENLMLTGDENIVRVAYTILWKVNNSSDYVFNLENVPGAVRDVAESAMREIVGKTKLEPLITDERDAVAANVQALMQEMLDEYEAGVLVSQVELKESQEPQQVENAFLQVVAAKQEAEQAILRARETENELIPASYADADKLIQEASGYKEAVIAESKGDASRFESIYGEYKRAPRVTRQRMYLETMETVYGPASKIILDDGAGSGVVPYLPLDKLTGNTAPKKSK